MLSESRMVYSTRSRQEVHREKLNFTYLPANDRSDSVTDVHATGGLYFAHAIDPTCV